MGIRDDYDPKTKYISCSIVNQYREGKVKSTPVRGMKEYLKPCAYKESEPVLRTGVISDKFQVTEICNLKLGICNSSAERW